MKVGEFFFSMVSNPATGKVSKTDFFTVLAYSLASGFFAWKNIVEPFNIELWMVYLGVVGGHNVLSKSIAVKGVNAEHAAGSSDAPKASGG